MRIVLAGGGTGGHFYPLIAIAEELRKIQEEEKIFEMDIYYFGDKAIDQELLFINNIKWRSVFSGKIRTYSSILNFTDIFVTLVGVFTTIIKMFVIYPDVVVIKGGYSSFPTAMAARILRIPVFVHESDTHPGKVNAWAGKFAKRIAITYPSSAKYFPKDRVALTGLPIRKDIKLKAVEGMYEYLKLSREKKTITIIGGSSGAMLINDVVVDSLPLLLSKYQIIHQTGAGEKYTETVGRASIVLENNPNKDYYKPFDYFNTLATKMVAGASDVIISRAGATSIAEISHWKIPAILVPITNSNGNHQRLNAYEYARTGAAVVIEESNLTPNILFSEINRILDNQDIYTSMVEAENFVDNSKSAEVIAKEIISIANKHY